MRRGWPAAALLAFVHLLPCAAQVKAASYLGMCSPRWPCGPSLAVFDGLPVKAAGVLVSTFGDACPCAKKFLSLTGQKYIRLHIANCTCFPERGRKCGRDEPFRGESIGSADAKLRRHDRQLLRRYRRNLRVTRRILSHVDRDTTVRLSLCLESEFSGPARQVLLTEARKAIPNAVFVDSVVARRCLSGLVCEKHGAAPAVAPPCLTDTDGDDFRDGYSPAPQCEASFLWQPAFNLIGSSTFVEPRLRTHAPSQRDFDQLAATLR